MFGLWESGMRIAFNTSLAKGSLSLLFASPELAVPMREVCLHDEQTARLELPVPRKVSRGL